MSTWERMWLTQLKLSFGRYLGQRGQEPRLAGRGLRLTGTVIGGASYTTRLSGGRRATVTSEIRNLNPTKTLTSNQSTRTQQRMDDGTVLTTSRVRILDRT